ncbi:MAG: RNA polymerase sigma factor [Armatimonadota bacterium]
MWNVDRQTLDALTAGDPDAWEKMLSLCRRQVFNIAYSFVGSAEDAEDLAQEALLQVYRRISGFRGDSDLSTWVYRVTVNVCIGRLRRRRPQPVSLEQIGGEATTWAEDPSPLVLESEQQRIVRRAVAELPPKLSAPVILHYFEGMNYEEVAKVLRLPLGTVKSRINRAKMLLRDRLKEYVLCGEVECA